MLDCRHNNLTKPALRVSTSTHSYTPNPPLSPAFSHTFKHNYHFRQKLNTGAVRFFKSIQKLKRGNNKNCSQNKQDRLNVFGCHNFLLSLLSAPCRLLTSLVLLIRYQLFLSNPSSGNLQYILHFSCSFYSTFWLCPNPTKTFELQRRRRALSDRLMYIIPVFYSSICLGGVKKTQMHLLLVKSGLVCSSNK